MITLEGEVTKVERRSEYLEGYDKPQTKTNYTTISFKIEGSALGGQIVVTGSWPIGTKFSCSITERSE